MTTSRATLAFACGSKSITRTFFSRSTKAPARLITVVVFPTQPLLFATVIMRGRVGAGFVIPFPLCPDRSRSHDTMICPVKKNYKGKRVRYCYSRAEGNPWDDGDSTPPSEYQGERG